MADLSWSSSWALVQGLCRQPTKIERTKMAVGKLMGELVQRRRMKKTLREYRGTRVDHSSLCPGWLGVSAVLRRVANGAHE